LRNRRALVLRLTRIPVSQVLLRAFRTERAVLSLSKMRVNAGGVNTGGVHTRDVKGGVNTGGVNTGGVNTGGVKQGGVNTGGVQWAGAGRLVGEYISGELAQVRLAICICI